jgi:SAM-dependent methyltransferase
MRALGPASVLGLDLSERNVALAAKLFGREGLSFRQGDAEALPFAPGSFDVAVNVESSHLYPHPERFFREVHRVLRPGGTFLFVDLGERARMRGLSDQFRRAGFEVVAARDITRNVTESIRRDDDRRRRILSSLAQSEEDFRELAAWAKLVGTPGYHAYCDGREQYWSYVLRKPRGAGSP